jgi:four helix bundle protein
MEQSVRVFDFKDLLVWQKAMLFAKQVNQLTQRFPREERFALTSQVRRAAVSVPSNIAEGHARQGREFFHFLLIARGSLAEVETQLILAVSLGYLEANSVDDLRGLMTEIRKMCSSLARKLRDSSDSNP